MEWGSVICKTYIFNLKKKTTTPKLSTVPGMQPIFNEILQNKQISEEFEVEKGRIRSEKKA